MDQAVDTLEAITFVLGIVTIVLVVRRSVWNFPFGIALVSLSAIVFGEARLYSDMLLQGFFLLANAYGWRQWRRHPAAGGAVVVTMMPARDRAMWVLGWAVATVVWGTVMARTTDAAYPWWDAGIAMGSVAAQVMMARRWIENWHVWIAVDIASVALYAAKDLWLMAVLYVIFLLLSVWGLVDWRAAWRRDRGVRAAAFA
ncbi:nicotinamide riboside transporter PnuC [Sphingomonas sp.]|uniref:nicotinamide riboside transporter PnuC n=1 Tax=Sphingomonas sp. TaxID=28214 RepID=UPI0035BC12C6